MEKYDKYKLEMNEEEKEKNTRWWLNHLYQVFLARSYL